MPTQDMPCKQPIRDGMIQEDGSEITLIHFVYQDGLPPAWRIACVPNLKEFHATIKRSKPWLRSDDPRAVTCPNCKDTPNFKARAATCNK